MSTWRRRRRNELPDLSTFDESEDYTGRELEAFADAMLKADSKQFDNYGKQTGILFEDNLYNRRKREVYAKSKEANGIVDPTLTASIASRDERGRVKGDGQTMYNRTHPEGRKVNSPEQRKKNSASYYR